ncbi:MAG: ABC transporter substrate-binding protein [Lentimonas sp.]
MVTISRNSYRPFFMLSALLLSMFLMVGCKEAPQVERVDHPIPEDAVVAACEPGEYGGVFIINETSPPKTFNYLVPGNLPTFAVQEKYSSPLVKYDPRTQAVGPYLAKSWDISEDSQTFTFHLREGIRWSDGEPFTAEDVKFTFDVIFADETDAETGKVRPIFPSRYYEDMKVNGEKPAYRMIDETTFEVSLPTVFAPFLLSMENMIVLPKHKLGKSLEDKTFFKQWSTQTAINTPEEIVSLGPFVVHSYRPGERLVMTPNPHFWRVDSVGQRLPYIDYLIFKFVAESNTETIHFATGQSDAAAISAADLDWIKKGEATYDFTVHEKGLSTNVSFFWFNQHLGSNEDGEPYMEPHKKRWFTDKRFRQAVQTAFNRKGIIDALLFGKGEPLNSMIPSSRGVWHNPNLPTYDYDPERARELLAESGFTWDAEGKLRDSKGVRVEIELLAVDGVASADTIAVTFVENMKEIGMSVKLSKVDFVTLLAKTDETFDYDLTFLSWGSTGAGYDPGGSKALYLSSGIYHQWYPDQEEPATEWEARIDKLFLEQESTLDLEKRIANIHEIQAILAEELPLLYIFSGYGYVGVQNKWQNIFIPPTGSLFWNIDEVWTAETDE